MGRLLDLTPGASHGPVEMDVVQEAVELPRGGQRAIATPRAIGTVLEGRAALVVALSLLMCLGIALRLAGLTHQSLWLDEAFSVYTAAHAFPQITAFVAGSDAHPPLYYLLLHVWMVFGTSVFVLRLLSVLASVGSLVPMYLLSRRLARPGTALLATGLMAVSAFELWYAQEVRMYALVTLATLVAAYALVRASHEPGIGAWLLFTGAMLAGVYLDYSALAVYAALALWVAAAHWRRPRVYLPFAVSSCLLFLGYLPWLPAVWHQAGAAEGLTGWIRGANGNGLVNIFADLFFNRTNLLQSDTGTLATLEDVVSLALVICALWLPRKHPSFGFLALWLGLPCVLAGASELGGHPVAIARNFGIVQPALLLLLALAVEEVWSRRSPNPLSWGQRIIVLALPGVLIVGSIRSERANWSTTLKEDWRDAAALVAREQQPTDLVLFDAYFTEMPFDYYFWQDLPPGKLPDERGYQLEESLLFANLAPPVPGMQPGPQLAKYPRIWLVLSHSGAAPPELPLHYQLTQQAQFPGITVQLYQTLRTQSRVTATADPPARNTTSRPARSWSFPAVPRSNQAVLLTVFNPAGHTVDVTVRFTGEQERRPLRIHVPAKSGVEVGLQESVGRAANSAFLLTSTGAVSVERYSLRSSTVYADSGTPH